MRVVAVPAPLVVYGAAHYAISWWRTIAIAFLVLMSAVLVPAAARADCGLSELHTQQANLDAAISIPMTVDDVVAQARTGAPPPRLTALTKVGLVTPCPEYTATSDDGKRFLAGDGLFNANQSFRQNIEPDMLRLQALKQGVMIDPNSKRPLDRSCIPVATAKVRKEIAYFYSGELTPVGPLLGVSTAQYTRLMRLDPNYPRVFGLYQTAAQSVGFTVPTPVSFTSGQALYEKYLALHTSAHAHLPDNAVCGWAAL